MFCSTGKEEKQHFYTYSLYVNFVHKYNLYFLAVCLLLMAYGWKERIKMSSNIFWLQFHVIFAFCMWLNLWRGWDLLELFIFPLKRVKGNHKAITFSPVFGLVWEHNVYLNSWHDPQRWIYKCTNRGFHLWYTTYEIAWLPLAISYNSTLSVPKLLITGVFFWRLTHST